MCLEPSQSDSRKPVEPNDATEPQHVQARCGHVSCLEAANRLLVQLSNALIAKMEAKDETVSLLESQIQMHCERTMAENEMHKKRVKVMEARIHYLENDLKKVLNRS